MTATFCTHYSDLAASSSHTSAEAPVAVALEHGNDPSLTVHDALLTTLCCCMCLQLEPVAVTVCWLSGFTVFGNVLGGPTTHTALMALRWLAATVRPVAQQ